MSKQELDSGEENLAGMIQKMSTKPVAQEIPAHTGIWWKFNSH